MIPRESTAPVNDIKKPIDKKVPLTKPVITTLRRLTNIASLIPISYKTIKITMFAKPILTPGIPMLGIKDSAIDKTIAIDDKMPTSAIFLTVILANHHIIHCGSLNNN